VQECVVVTHATSYDVLVGGAILYPLGVTLDFWEEIPHCRPRWQTRNNCKDFLLVIFIKGKTRKSNKSINLASLHVCHIMMLQQQHFDLLPTLMVQGYQHSLTNNITLLEAQDLDKIGPTNLVILGWSC
jgi:hypothetical protein